MEINIFSQVKNKIDSKNALSYKTITYIIICVTTECVHLYNTQLI